MSLTIAIFAEALSRTLGKMLDVPISVGPITESQGNKIYADVSACFHLGSEVGANYHLVMTASQTAVHDVANRLLGGVEDIDEHLLADTMGEILNIIVASARARSSNPFSFDLPVVHCAASHEVVTVSSRKAEEVHSNVAEHAFALYLVSTGSPNQGSQNSLVSD